MAKNSIDITKMLHSIIDLELTVDDAKELLLGPEARRQAIFVQLDLKLSALADAAGWADVLEEHAGDDHQKVVELYVQTLALFLLYSAKRQWTFLVVLSDEQWQRITSAEKKDKLVDLEREYLAIKNFLNGAYYNHRQEDFRHAWHLLLKMGIVDLGITPAEISANYQTMIADTEKKYED